MEQIQNNGVFGLEYVIVFLVSGYFSFKKLFSFKNSFNITQY